MMFIGTIREGAGAQSCFKTLFSINSLSLNKTSEIYSALVPFFDEHSPLVCFLAMSVYFFSANRSS